LISLLFTGKGPEQKLKPPKEIKPSTMRENAWVQFRFDQDYQQFIEKLADASRRVDLQLRKQGLGFSMCYHVLQYLNSFEDDVFQKVLDALNHAPISLVDWDIDLLSVFGGMPLDRFKQLCQVLKTANKVKIRITSDYFPTEALSVAAETFTSISEVFFV
jgi:hypothetical protein